MALFKKKYSTIVSGLTSMITELEALNKQEVQNISNQKMIIAKAEASMDDSESEMAAANGTISKLRDIVG